MNLSIAIFVFCACFVVQIASDANYAITFDAQAPITQFIYHLSIPVGSPDSSNNSDAQGFWAGVTTADGQTLSQNVIENQDGPYSVLNNPVQDKPSICHSTRTLADRLNPVYHGDNLQASFIDNSHGNSKDPQWVDSFTITLHPADNQAPYSASIRLNTAIDPVPTPFTQSTSTPTSRFAILRGSTLMERRNAWVTSEATLNMTWVCNGSRYFVLQGAWSRIGAFILQDGVFACVGLVLAVTITSLSYSFCVAELLR
ncbi:hypothetical protein NA56DRAFT_709680 [Hyaloscypha hepaticicola]|uniref:Uncharacterized protein n=1 Tax=Hyaloscypha hepaticicola TaxID=2082293 RepID=A0A2J6PND8_9HELO|nr:hypothetical protein NA56DRAFT_709680 [Hyaloscypha hepaticicola]